MKIFLIILSNIIYLNQSYRKIYYIDHSNISSNTFNSSDKLTIFKNKSYQEIDHIKK